MAPQHFHPHGWRLRTLVRSIFARVVSEKKLTILNGAVASSLMTPTSLAATEFLQGCDLKTLQELMAGFTPVHLPDGVALFRQGDSGTAMYLIISGRLRMETTLEQGGRRQQMRSGRAT